MRIGNKYNSTTNDLLDNGSDLKPDFKDDHTLLYYHAGISNKGYWNPSNVKVH